LNEALVEVAKVENSVNLRINALTSKLDQAINRVDQRVAKLEKAISSVSKDLVSLKDATEKAISLNDTRIGIISRVVALQAYAYTCTKNDDFARKLEAIIKKFFHNTIGDVRGDIDDMIKDFIK
jgi:hypothetical protein